MGWEELSTHSNGHSCGELAIETGNVQTKLLPSHDVHIILLERMPNLSEVIVDCPTQFICIWISSYKEKKT